MRLFCCFDTPLKPKSYEEKLTSAVSKFLNISCKDLFFHSKIAKNDPYNILDREAYRFVIKNNEETLSQARNFFSQIRSIKSRIGQNDNFDLDKVIRYCKSENNITITRPGMNILSNKLLYIAADMAETIMKDELSICIIPELELEEKKEDLNTSLSASTSASSSC